MTSSTPCWEEATLCQVRLSGLLLTATVGSVRTLRRTRWTALSDPRVPPGIISISAWGHKAKQPWRPTSPWKPVSHKFPAGTFQISDLLEEEDVSLSTIILVSNPDHRPWSGLKHTLFVKVLLAPLTHPVSVSYWPKRLFLELMDSPLGLHQIQTGSF